jgi:hypothetical protein
MTSAAKTEATDKSSTDVQSNHSLDIGNGNARSSQRINIGNKADTKTINNSPVNG